MDYQTLAEAEKAAQGYVDGTMEGDGFQYDGAAIYSQQTRKYLRVYGNYPDERAHAEAAGRDWVEKSAASTESDIAPADRFHVVSLDQGFYTRYAIWDDEADGYYVDTDGVAEEFTSEWQAEEYRLKLQEQVLMERAKGLISDFCQSEYGSEPDFSDPAKIGIAYTTITDDEIPIQVNIDLVKFRLERDLNDEHLETRQYSSLQDLIANELEILDFSDLVHVSDEDIEQYRWHNREEATEKALETVESVSLPQENKALYSVGDTVYLDNKPFEITEVGLFDVHLRDPSQAYPVFRAESKERLEVLLRQDERNAHLFAVKPPALSEEEKLILEHEGQEDMKTLEAHPHPTDGFAGMTVLADDLTDKDNAGAALIEAAKKATGLDPVEVGTYRGFQMSVTLEDFGKKYVLTMQGRLRHQATLGSDPRGNLIRLDNALAQMSQRLQAFQTQLDETYHQQEAAKAELDKPFPYEEELRDKTARLIFLDAELNLDANKGGQQDQVVAKAARPSVLDKLRSQPAPSRTDKKQKRHEEVR